MIRLKAFLGSFSGRLRDEYLNESLFEALADVREIIEGGRIDSNRVRPNSSLDNLTPEEYAQANTTQTPEKTNLALAQ